MSSLGSCTFLREPGPTLQFLVLSFLPALKAAFLPVLKAAWIPFVSVPPADSKAAVCTSNVDPGPHHDLDLRYFGVVRCSYSPVKSTASFISTPIATALYCSCRGVLRWGPCRWRKLQRTSKSLSQQCSKFSLASYSGSLLLAHLRFLVPLPEHNCSFET